MIADIVIPILSLVAIFLFSVQKFSKQIHQTAGERFRALLRSATATRLRGLSLGAGFTALIQSSTATTVILVSIVNAGLLTFERSLAVVFGANIGTTITSQLVAFNVPNIAPYIILIGFVLMYFGRGYQQWGKPIFYFGLIFFSLALISLYMEPLRSNPQALAAFSQIDSLYAAILVGLIFTAIIQSSSVTSGLTLTLVIGGFLSFEQALGIIMGANIGTTVTALIASTVMNSAARKVAVAHFLFNVIGVLLFLPIFAAFIDIVRDLGGASERQVANAHVIFNLTTAVFFLLLQRPFYRLVNAVVR